MPQPGEIRYSGPGWHARAPLMFPARLSGLPSQWRIHNTYYEADARLLRADQYMLTTGSSRFHPHVGDLGVWTDAPYIQVHPAPRDGTCTPHDPASLFRQHLRLLGTNPANWTKNPIG